jgi:polyisoprenoid-binding protein YceI
MPDSVIRLAKIATPATASVSTGLRVFDSRLREADLLDSAAHPQARFVAERFVFDAGRLVEVKGEFTLRGVRQPLTLRALRFGCPTHPQLQREVCGGDFEGELDRAAFGASFGMPFVANRVRLRVQVEGIRR